MDTLQCAGSPVIPIPPPLSPRTLLAWQNRQRSHPPDPPLHNVRVPLQYQFPVHSLPELSLLGKIGKDPHPQIPLSMTLHITVSTNQIPISPRSPSPPPPRDPSPPPDYHLPPDHHPSLHPHLPCQYHH